MKSTGVDTNSPAPRTLVACETCGLVQETPEIPKGAIACCSRCRFKLFHRLPDSRLRTFTLSLAALILYFPANLYPIVTVQYHGLHSQTTIFQGIKGLFQGQQYFIGCLVFCTSILSPALKIIGLLLLSLTIEWPRWKKARTWIYKIIRIIDPWNMLEVFLLAICVSLVEMGEVATIHPGRGVFSFAAVVALTLLATLSFDPRLLWDNPEDKKRYE
ncbi:MAG TPA: paraquat-inducible protein A [Verrucomicrobiae bacterium]|nr:paraquat-inducible protein A [Verrucomicrobiae bacterium]